MLTEHKGIHMGKRYPNIHTTQGAVGVVFGDGSSALCIVF